MTALRLTTSSFPETAAARSDAPPAVDLMALPDAARASLVSREQMVRAAIDAIDRATRSGVGKIEAIARFSSSTPGAPPARTLRRWLDAWQREGRAGLLDRRGRKTDRPRDEMSSAAWQRFAELYLAPQCRSVQLCYDIVSGEALTAAWTWPSYRVVLARVRRDLPAFRADLPRLGQLRWERKYARRMETDYSSIPAGEEYVGDTHDFDFLAHGRDGKPCRLKLTAFEDKRSRKLVGWQISERSDSDTIIAALRDAILSHGAPKRMRVDNGNDYGAAAITGGNPTKRRFAPRDIRRVDSLCGRLGIEAHFTRKFNPQSKHIERLFGTICGRFSKLFDSYCGSSPAARPEDLYRRLRESKVELPTLDQVRARFAEWVEVYHATPHRGVGMDERCPLDVWAETSGTMGTAPGDVLEILCMRAERLTVGRNGVTWRGVTYGGAASELKSRWFGREVLVRIPPDDASVVYACDPESGRLIAACRQDRLIGVTRETLAEAHREQRAEKRAVKAALPALTRRRRDVVEYAIDRQAARAQALRAAAGTESQTITDAPVRLIPAAAEILPDLPRYQAGARGARGPRVEEPDDDFPAPPITRRPEPSVEDDLDFDLMLLDGAPAARSSSDDEYDVSP